MGLLRDTVNARFRAPAVGGVWGCAYAKGPVAGLLAPPGVPGGEAAVCEAKLGVCVSCGLTARPPRPGGQLGSQGFPRCAGPSPPAASALLAGSALLALGFACKS